jgi:mono/diheme cytochrome c family protein
MSKRLFAVIAATAYCAAAADQKVERGRYLVEEVGKCQVCHTPNNEKGELDKTKWMKGAVLNFAPITPVEGWHKTSPDLTSQSRLFERWKEEGLVKFMATGLNPKGGKADAPMPTYKLTQEDAEAVVAYLKSLP